MTGAIGLHGGGEYLAGDEPFIDALLGVAGRWPGRADRRLEVVVVPTAAARGLPDRAAANGVAAFERGAERLRLDAVVRAVPIVDAASATDPGLASDLASADLIHFAGGDPDVIPTVLSGSPAETGLLDAWRGGAVVAGASAGAMALAEWTWTPRGGLRGLALVRGVAVVPHYDDVRRTTWQAVIDRLAPGGLGYLGLDERTGVIGEVQAGDGRRWTVAGRGAAWWFPPDGEPLVARAGGTLPLPA